MSGCFNGMSDKSIFVFGSKIFQDRPKKDAISTLPLEMAWKIFSYLDDASLRIVYHTSKAWARIIYADKKLTKRLNVFELTLKFGSRELARIYRRDLKRIRRKKKKHYVVCGDDAAYIKRDYVLDSGERETFVGNKRLGDNFIIQSKRFRIY